MDTEHRLFICGYFLENGTRGIFAVAADSPAEAEQQACQRLGLEYGEAERAPLLVDARGDWLEVQELLSVEQDGRPYTITLTPE